MIGVLCAPGERPAVREFFELFKTPWTFWEPGRRFEVVIVSSAATPSGAFDARLVIAFSRVEMHDDHASPGVPSRGRGHTDVLEAGDLRLPLYTGTLALADDADLLGHSAVNGGALVVESVTGSCATIRCGYDLFSEVRFLLSGGQPPEWAGTPTLDLHVALVRQWIVTAGIPLWEIAPVPAGHEFLACLTHDVDFLGIRRHRWDRTLAGFLLRASVGSLRGLVRGRCSVRQLLRNWAAVLSLPLVHLGVRPDFWLPFDRYIKADGEFRSTFFLVPFRDRPGRGLDGRSDRRRGVRYAAEETRPWLPRLRSLGFEVGVHGLDAWNDLPAATAELREVARLTDSVELGVRMHWLYFDESSFATLDEAGFVYDATVGYNDAIGFRAGTTQVFRPLSATRLLELPLHIQDSALFFPARMNCTESEALDLCRAVLDWTQRLGGVVTLSWHERSLVPERQWDGTYTWLLAQLRQRGAYVGSARDVVAWFSVRRSVDLQGVEIDPDRLHALSDPEPSAAAAPGLTLRFHRDSLDVRAAGFVDVPVHVDSLAALVRDHRPAGRPETTATHAQMT
jgi:hypothetical protein